MKFVVQIAEMCRNKCY